MRHNGFREGSSYCVEFIKKKLDICNGKSMSALANFYFPKARQSRKQYKLAKNPWIAKDVLALVKSKNKLFLKYLKTQDPSVYAEYRKCRNKVTHVKEQSKRKYYRAIFGRCDTKSA